MEFVLRVDPALDLTALQCFDDRRHPTQKRLRSFLGLEARIESGFRASLGRLQECGLRAVSHFGTHEDPDLLEAPPLAIELEQAADLEKARRDVEALRDLCPVVKVARPCPSGDAVVDDEQFAACPDSFQYLWTA